MGTLYAVNLVLPVGTETHLEQIRLNAGESRTLLSTGGGLRGVTFDAENRCLILSQPHSIDAFDIQQSSSSQLIDLGFRRPLDIEFSQSVDAFFWYDFTGRRIEAAKSDGTGRRTILTGIGTPPLAVDDVNQKIYIEDRISSSTTTLLRANYDGSELEVVTSFVPTANSMAIDARNEMIYWTSSAGFGGDGGVYRVDFSGGSFEEIFVMGSNLDPSGIALDVRRGYVYFGQKDTHQSSVIMRIDLDGGNPEVIAGDFDNIIDMVFVENAPSSGSLQAAR